jgi:hypothetical protein
MSRVTTVILSIGTLDWHEGSRLPEINAFFENPQAGFVSLEDPNLPHGWYGGTKYLEAELYIGSFNYLDLDALLTHLSRMRWEEPDCIQLIVKEQEDDVFRILALPKLRARTDEE